MRATADACGCFPTGRHYAGIAHLLRAVIRGLVEGHASDASWDEVPIALIDVETTGRDASADRVIEIGIVIGKKGEVLARYNWLVNPARPIPAEASSVHGIKDDDVKDSPRFEAIAHEVVAALQGCVPAAYNAAFDRAFVANELARVEGVRGERFESAGLKRDVEWIDPLVWAREIQQTERSRALADVAARLGVALENAHRASDDAEAALRVFYALAREGRIPRAYGAMIQEQRRLAFAQADERRRWKS